MGEHQRVIEVVRMRPGSCPVRVNHVSRDVEVFGALIGLGLLLLLGTCIGRCVSVEVVENKTGIANPLYVSGRLGVVELPSLGQIKIEDALNVENSLRPFNLRVMR